MIGRLLRWFRNLNPWHTICALRAEIAILESTVRFRDNTIRDLCRENERLKQGFRVVRGGPR